MLIVLAAVAGYGLGSVPTGQIVARVATAGRVDLRTTADGNAGAANAIATLGVRWGLVVLVVDVSKGAVATALGEAAAGGAGAALAGTAAVAGHIWPVWSLGRGGKGVATSAGYCLAAFPAYFPIDIAVAIASTALRRSGAVAVRIASVVWVATAGLWWWRDWPNLWGPAPDAWLVLGAAATSTLIALAFARGERATRAAAVVA